VAVFDLQQRGQRYFYQKRRPKDQVAKLYYREGLEGEEHLLLDRASFGTTAAHAALDFYAPSWDGQLLVYGISLGGSEDSTLQVLEVAGKRIFQESIERTTLSVVAWATDDRGFFCLRYNEPTPGMKPSERLYNARTYRHVLGEHPQGDGDPVVFVRPWRIRQPRSPRGSGNLRAGLARLRVCACGREPEPEPRSEPLDALCRACRPHQRRHDTLAIGSQREQTRELWTDQMAFSLWQFKDPDFQPK
jgi:hypothetical protein